VKDEVGDAAAAIAVCETPAQAAITAIKTRIAELNRRDTEALEQIERGREQIQREQRVRDEVAVEMNQANAELDALVAAPIPAGVDPTAWLPDELLILILLQVGWGRGCEAVCRRWRVLRQDGAMTRQLRDGRWEEYAAGRLEPRRLHGQCKSSTSLAVGPNEKVYAGSTNAMVWVWSTRDGKLLQTLRGHKGSVDTLAVAEDGAVYSGSCDRTVRVWSGEDGTHLRTLTGHADDVCSLAIGANGDVFSGSADTTIRVWSGRDGTHLHMLEGHTSTVCALAVGPDKLYSAANEVTIRVWSISDMVHLQTLEGHTSYVMALAIGPDGDLFSGSLDKTVCVWSAEDGSYLRELECSKNVFSLAVGPDGTVFTGSDVGDVHMWHSESGEFLRSLDCYQARLHPDPMLGSTGPFVSVAVSAAGTLYVGGENSMDLDFNYLSYGVDRPHVGQDYRMQVW
jgi:WD40 repeat protein